MNQRPTILITRPLEAARSFEERIQNLGATIFVSPVVELNPLETNFTLPDDAAIIFSSIFSVRCAAKTVQLAGRRVYAVGPKTAETLRDHGAIVCAEAQNANSLAVKIIDEASQTAFVHLRGRYVAGNIAGVLQDAGKAVHSIELYDQKAMRLNEDARQSLRGENPVILPLFSPRTSAILSRQLNELGSDADLHLLSMSGSVDSAWNGPEPVTRTVSKKPNGDEMISALRKLVLQMG